MTGKKLLLGVVVLLVVSLVLGGIAGCCPANGEPKPTPTAPVTTPTAPAETPAPPGDGAPTLKVGDSWTYDVSWPGTRTVDPQEGTITASIAKADATGYEVNFQFDATPRVEKVSPLGLGVTWKPPMKRWYDGNLDLTKLETTIDAGTYGELLLAMTVQVTRTGNKWPLAEGMEWNEKLNMDVGGLLQKEWDLTVKVEGVEQVTVPAGTFECYHIVSYDGTMPAVEEWFSMDVKGTVKRVDELLWRGGPDTWELKSYNVSP